MASKFWICLLGIGCLFVSMLETETASGQGPTRAREVPRVLIIGDSISLGYTPYVASILKGRAEVVHNPGNAPHTGLGLRRLKSGCSREIGTSFISIGDFGICAIDIRNPRSPVSEIRNAGH